ncbi:hypothetical protein [Pedobacter sp. KBW01]|nr:hypothetical protein [Pedobacter sp. KBW01]
MAYSSKNKKNTPYIILGVLVVGGGLAWTFFTEKGKAWFATIKAKFSK